MCLTFETEIGVVETRNWRGSANVRICTRVKTRREGVFMRKLVFAEDVALDTARLCEIYSEMGDFEADRVICEATEAVALALARLGRAHRAGDCAAIAAQAEHLGKAAGFLGLPELQRVASDVAVCARGGAGPGLDATVARLARVGDIALTVIWDPRDLIS